MHTAMILMLFIFGLSFSLSKSKVITFIFFFLLFLVASLRFGEGPDYFAYYDAFNALSSNPFEELEKPLLLNQELGFRLIGSTLKFLGFSYQFYLAFFALVSCFFIARLSYEYSVYPVMAGLLFYAAFFFTWPYSGIRQGFVLCVGSYYLIRCTKENRTTKFLGVVGILSFVHLSAVILPVYFLAQKIKKSPTIQFLIIGIGLIFSIAIQYIFLANISLIPFSERILFYEDYFFESGYLDIKTLSRMFIFAITLRIYFVAKNRGDEFLAGLCSGLIISFIVYLSFKFSEIVAAQLSLYGFLLLILVLPNFLAVKDRFLPKNIYFIMIVAFASLYFSKTYSDMKYMSAKNAYKEAFIK